MEIKETIWHADDDNTPVGLWLLVLTDEGIFHIDGVKIARKVVGGWQNRDFSILESKVYAWCEIEGTIPDKYLKEINGGSNIKF